MEETEPQKLVPYWQKLHNASLKILLLDYDGTLAPFQVERDRAFPYPGVREILDEIQAAGQTRLVIISGRAVADLLPLLGLKNYPEIWGSHGFEHRLPDGALVMQDMDPKSLQSLAAAHEWMEKHGYANDCEKKPSSLAFHWRRLAADQRKQLEKTVRSAWSPSTGNGNLQIHPFDGGLELRYAGFHKGEAVKQVLAECDNDFFMAYLGDDLTDEDAFKALQGRGLSVLVRPAYRKTLADCWLKPPEELLDFLKKWHRFSSKK